MSKVTFIERCKKESIFDEVEIWVAEQNGEYRIAFIEDDDHYRHPHFIDYYHSISRELYEALLRVAKLRELAES